MNVLRTLALAAWGVMMATAAPAVAATAAEGAAVRQALLTALVAQAKAADAGFTGFSAERGAALFGAQRATGKPDTPSCTTCHTADPRQPGRTRAGKEIAPMAVSASPERFTDPDKVAKWFERNCNGVIGRLCSAVEQGDFLTFMISR
jgi:cytochrome c peroxidase